MNVHKGSHGAAKLVPLGSFKRQLGQPESVLFEPWGKPVLRARAADIRSCLRSLAAMGRQWDTVDDPASRYVAKLFLDAAVALGEGHGVDIGDEAELDLPALIEQAPKRADMEHLSIPHPVTPVVAKVGQRALLFVLVGDPVNRRLSQAIVAQLVRTGSGQRPTLTPMALIVFAPDGEHKGHLLISSDAPEQMARLALGLGKAARSIARLVAIPDWKPPRTEAANASSDHSAEIATALSTLDGTDRVSRLTEQGQLHAAPPDLFDTAFPSGPDPEASAAHPFDGGMPPFRNVAELRDATLDGLSGTLRRGVALFAYQDEPGTVTQTLEGLGSGQLFDFTATLIDLADPQVDAQVKEITDIGAVAFEAGTIGLPYERFIAVARVKIFAEPDIVLVMAEPVAGIGGPALRLCLLVPRWGPDRMPHIFPLAVSGIAVVKDGRLVVRPSEGLLEGVLQGSGDTIAARLVFTMLLKLADDRVVVQREVAPAKLNAARARRRKPLIAPLWKVGPAKDLYVTEIRPPQRRRKDGCGGTHRSPIAHERRGHQRRLRSGRTIWIRSTRIGDLAKHLTRKRAFYQLRGA